MDDVQNGIQNVECWQSRCLKFKSGLPTAKQPGGRCDAAGVKGHDTGADKNQVMNHERYKQRPIAFLFGGRSAEHEISVITALQAIEALDTRQYKAIPVYIAPSGRWYIGAKLLDKDCYRRFATYESQLEELSFIPGDPEGPLFEKRSGTPLVADVYFLLFHGQYGEDGCLQGALELAGVPYTGCNVIASSIAMNKHTCKMLLQAAGVPVLPWVLANKGEAQRSFEGVIEKVQIALGSHYPLFVKPCNLGSSIGIGIARDVEALKGALAKVFLYDAEAIVEPCIENLMEINVSVIEGEPPQASVIEIPLSTGPALTYEDKYLRNGSKSGSGGMASLTRVIDPPDLPKETKETIQNLALQGFIALGCAGVSRFDFIYDKSQGGLYFNEVNPIPGSLAYYLWEKSTPRMLYPDIIDRLVKGALRRHEMRLSLKQSIEFRALA